MGIKLFDNQTTAGSATFKCSMSDIQPPVTLAASGLTGADVIDVNISTDGGATFTPLWEKGVRVQLSATNNSVTLYGPGVYQVSKGATQGAVTVYLASNGMA